jgi:hypothetical protein
MKDEEKRLSLYSKKFDYSLGSVGRAPDEDGNISYST